VIAMEMAHHHISRIPQLYLYPPAHLLAHRHLGRVGEQSFAPIPERHAWVDDDLAILDLHHAGETVHAE
jgi:hypothetical protein